MFDDAVHREIIAEILGDVKTSVALTLGKSPYQVPPGAYATTRQALTTIRKRTG
jgi:hypothetical protein